MNSWRGLLPAAALEISEAAAQRVNAFSRDYDPTPRRQWLQLTYPDPEDISHDAPETLAAFAELAQRTSLTRLSFSRRMLQQRPFAGVSLVVPMFRHVKALSFAEVWDAPAAVALLLAQPNSLRTLCIQQLTSLPGCQQLGAAFRTHYPPLRSLKLVASLRSMRDANVSACAAELCVSLRYLTRLRHLVVRVPASETVAQDIAKAVDAASALRSLDLSECNFTDPHLGHLLPSLSNALALRRLSLAQNKDLGAAGIVALARHLPPSLCALDVSDTRSGDEGAIALIKTIASQFKPSIQWLSLNGNEITDTGAAFLNTALANGLEIRWLYLKRNRFKSPLAMRLYGTAVRSEFAEIVAIGFGKRLASPRARKHRMNAIRSLYGCLLLIGMNRQLPFLERSPISRLPSDLILHIFRMLEERCFPPPEVSWTHWPDAQPHPKLSKFLKRVMTAPEGALRQALEHATVAQ